MIQKLLASPIFHSKFLHYFVIISSLTFLFTLGPRILIDQLSSSKPNTALAQDCPQQPCPSVPVPPQPPQECTTVCPSGTSGTCGGHKYWIESESRFGDCQCETAAQTCQAPVLPPPAPVPPPPAPPPPPQPSSCVDQLFDCSCNGMDFKCMHRHIGCDTSVETHNELSGASACHPTTNPPPPPPPTTTNCQDHLISCNCSGTNFQCVHQRTDCTTFMEIRNDQSGASACLPGATPGSGVGGNSSSNSAANSSSNSSANASANQSQRQSQAQSQSTAVTNNNNNNNTNNNTQSQTVNVAGITWVTPMPTATPTITSSPTATPSTSTTTVIVGQGGGTPRMVGQTQVQGTSTVQELPNTGLPAAGLLLASLGPIGWKLRKYAFKSFNPSSIWVDRELKK